MCDFKPGDEVVCVNSGWLFDLPWHFRRAPELTKGSHYTVLSVYDGGVNVYEATPAEGYWSFDASRFRKIQKHNRSLSIDAFLTIKPGFEEPRRVTTPAKENA